MLHQKQDNNLLLNYERTAQAGFSDQEIKQQYGIKYDWKL